MESLKKVVTAWYVWAIIALVFGILLFQRTTDLASLLPFGLLLLCPVMMFFMMDSHHHKK